MDVFILISFGLSGYVLFSYILGSSEHENEDLLWIIGTMHLVSFLYLIVFVILIGDTI